MSLESAVNLYDTEPEWATIIVSPCGKYELQAKDDPEILVYSDYAETVKKSKYIIHRVVRKSNNSLIFEYRTLNETANILVFFTQDGTDWLLTGLEYMSQLFINLDTGMYYDNCRILDSLSDNRYKRMSNADLENASGGFADGEGFIWCNITIGDDKTALVEGCYWAFPYETRKYDLSNIPQGWPLLETIEDD